jgi:hypothetical protein
MRLGQLKLSEALPLLEGVAHFYGLNLYRVKDFRLARLIVANKYFNGPWNTEN